LYGEAYIQSFLGVDTKLLVDAELGGEGRRPVRYFPLSKLRKSPPSATSMHNLACAYRLVQDRDPRWSARYMRVKGNQLKAPHIVTDH
jgi:hypothetical protein